jgi:transposase
LKCISRPSVGRCKSSGCLVKKSPAAAERVEADRQAFRRRVARLDRRRFIFTDETGFHLAMTRAYGRAARGERVGESVPRNHGRGFSLIGSLGLRGLFAPLSIEGAVDTMIFDTYLREMLVCELRPSDILLLDNLPVHLASQVEESVRQAQAEVLWLPAYSPDLSPIENCWSKIKTLVRGRRPRTPKELHVALRDALRAVTLKDIEGWFNHCGY